MGEPLKLGLFEGRQACAQALRDTLVAACASEAREIFCVDSGFVDWPLSDRLLIEALTTWVRRGRVLHLLGRELEPLRLRHPRFVQWRTTYDHCVDAREHDVEGSDPRAPHAAICVEGGNMPFSLRVLDRELQRGVVSADVADIVRVREWFDVLAQRSSPAFPASVLGL